jgi:hypothetical protein
MKNKTILTYIMMLHLALFTCIDISDERGKFKRDKINENTNMYVRETELSM